MEASGTGNMKFALNGALTIGTYDGANIEIREAVGAENFFLFGLKAEEISVLRRTGTSPQVIVEKDPLLKEALRLLASGFFSGGDTSLFKPIIDNLLFGDPYFVLSDFASYQNAQSLVDQTYLKQKKWTQMSILNVARCGRFSSDRAIREYKEKIWSSSDSRDRRKRAGPF
jgi:starch phosphorylase